MIHHRKISHFVVAQLGWVVAEPLQNNRVRLHPIAAWALYEGKASESRYSDDDEEFIALVSLAVCSRAELVPVDPYLNEGCAIIPPGHRVIRLADGSLDAELEEIDVLS